MCLILTAYNAHPDYPLIVLANRDEFYSRPTHPAHWWEPDADILAGKDLKAGGTWLGVNKASDFCALTNYRDPSRFRADARSRGMLVSEFLINQTTVPDYHDKYLSDANAYNDFNLLMYKNGALYYFNSLEKKVKTLDSGIYGLSNEKLDSDWPKVRLGRERLAALLNSEDFSVSDAFDILGDRSLAVDEELPDTGIGIVRERFLSAIHIDAPGYGTRSSNVVLYRSDSKVEFYEKDHLNVEKSEFAFLPVIH